MNPLLRFYNHCQSNAFVHICWVKMGTFHLAGQKALSDTESFYWTNGTLFTIEKVWQTVENNINF